MATEVKIGDLIIRSDSQCWTVYRPMIVEKGKTKGEKYEAIIGYYPFLSTCLEAILERDVSGTDKKNIEELLKEVKYLKYRIEELKKEEFEACKVETVKRYEAGGRGYR